MLTIPIVPKLKKYVESKFDDSSSDIELSEKEDNIEEYITENRNSMNIADKELNRVINLHKFAEKFDPRTKEVFKYLQVFTAICDSLVMEQ